MYFLLQLYGLQVFIAILYNFNALKRALDNHPTNKKAP